MIVLVQSVVSTYDANVYSNDARRQAHPEPCFVHAMDLKANTLESHLLCAVTLTGKLPGSIISSRRGTYTQARVSILAVVKIWLFEHS